MFIEISTEEAEGILHCLKRTHAKGKYLDMGMAFEVRLQQALKSSPIISTNSNNNYFSEEELKTLG